MKNNNQNSHGAVEWIFLALFAVIFAFGVVLFYRPTDNTKPVLLPIPTITYKKTATSAEASEFEPLFKAVETAPEDSYTYLDIRRKSDTVYLLGEREECKKAGGEFYYSFFTDQMTCTKQLMKAIRPLQKKYLITS